MKSTETDRPSEKSILGNRIEQEASVRPASWADVFDLLRRLESHGVDYVLVGGYALNYNGLTRQTGDVDILVANSPENNKKWIAALGELPDGAAMELLPDADDPFPRDDENADDPGVIRVADVYLIDVMPKACGLTIDDIRQYIRRVPHNEFYVNVLDLNGLRLLKQGVREKDAMDLKAIEAALKALRNAIAEHITEMSRRQFVAEEPPKERMVFRASAELSQTERNALLAKIVRRAVNDSDNSGLGVDYLNTYCDDNALFGIANQDAPLSDLRAILADYGISVPEP